MADRQDPGRTVTGELSKADSPADYAAACPAKIAGPRRCHIGHGHEADVRRICLALPGVTERSSWGQPAWFAKTLMARIWEDGVLTVKTAEREALAGTDPETYFWTPHHERSPQLVLVRLAGSTARNWPNCSRSPTGWPVAAELTRPERRAVPAERYRSRSERARSSAGAAWRWPPRVPALLPRPPG